MLSTPILIGTLVDIIKPFVETYLLVEFDLVFCDPCSNTFKVFFEFRIVFFTDLGEQFNTEVIFGLFIENECCDWLVFAGDLASKLSKMLMLWYLMHVYAVC